MMLKIFNISFSIIIIAMMLMVTMIWFWKNDAFELKAAKIQGNRYVSKEEIFELAGIDFSKDIFEVNTGEIEKRILKHGMIEKVSVTRFLPSALKIKVRERDLIAAISGSEISAVGVDGNILTQFPMESVYDLPVITGFHFQSDSSGVRSPDNPELVQQAVAMLNEIKSRDLVLYHELSDLNYSRDHGFIFYLKERNIPVVFGFDDYLNKIQYFLTIYHHLLDQNELEQAKVIDVRFKDQVVVKNQI
jgi:cell division septal protein FtsQ